MQGFLNLNKPFGLTSHDCVANVRRRLRIKRVGHGGTLDPNATGVLPIALGRATRLLQFLRTDKVYHATIRFGIRTSTDDLEGDVCEQQSASTLELEQVHAILPKFRGVIQQVPPRYSAIQVNGKRLYDLARSGEAVEVPVRTVEIYQITPLDWRSGECPELDVAITCGSGTYIRAIARDMGDILDTGATLAALIRTESSGFCLDDSLTLDELGDRLQNQTFEPISPDLALNHVPPQALNPDLARRWRQGQKVIVPDSLRHENSSEIVRVQNEMGDFLGIGEWHHDPTESEFRLIPKVVIRPA
ncbi:MAG TPA: tRNA pseudouridine(55) synthase TruB [Elainellaceae cyanobacterium]